MKILPNQKEGWDCGIAAAEYYLAITSHKSKFPWWKKAIELANSTPEDGTPPGGIIDLLRSVTGNNYDVFREPLHDVILPSIINYQNDGDGHWGVLIGKSADYAWVYDPTFGMIVRNNRSTLSRKFFSRRYGANVSVREV